MAHLPPCRTLIIKPPSPHSLPHLLLQHLQQTQTQTQTLTTTMPRIFLLYNLIYSIFLSFLPKNLRHYLPKSHTQQQQQQIQNDTVSQPSQPPQTPRTSRMNPDQLQRIFQMFDKNNDGTITKHELNESLENMKIFISDEDLVRMIDKVDINNDGCVDLDEFGVLYKEIMDNQENEEDMMEAFNVFDQNRDGFIAVEELRSVLESLGLKQGKVVDDCRRMIMKVDVDGDGRVSFNEFKEMMKSGGFVNLAQS
ncbi:putative EF-hand domain pair protein CML [Helianthus annuus]|uniref:EF-hand domain pair protein CML n=2 Tax=Helianthus annuus TaxID=4232 RepID=A0A9K3JJB4_HELAN|nr:calmodulin-like protein 3 [Helianthus annuus]KAF5816360.1 putative EF-hand domain pair protein CML [Helianthus annuus]KAJ0775490.1 putative EF-hand domain-containing protein [Helianthus annuus]KAJ0937686.1 putative EF-hand domain pair protein CML [Helianthus annuus]KAJ0945626.1 putative EF-hand domain pair protein CML [Helianthus annuus]